MKKSACLILFFLFVSLFSNCKEKGPDYQQIQVKKHNLKNILINHSRTFINDISTVVIDTSSVIVDSTSDWHLQGNWKMVSYSRNGNSKIRMDEGTKIIIGEDKKNSGVVMGGEFIMTQSKISGLRIDSGIVKGDDAAISSSIWTKEGKLGQETFIVNTSVLKIIYCDSVIEEKGAYILSFVPDIESSKRYKEIRDTGQYSVSWKKGQNKMWRPEIISTLSNEEIPALLLYSN